MLIGVEASPGLIPAIADTAMDEVAAWQNRPLEPCHRVVFMPAFRGHFPSGDVVARPIRRAPNAAPTERKRAARE